MMVLDTHTLLVLFAILSLLQAALLGLVALHTSPQGGSLLLWTLASLFISLGLVPAYFYSLPRPGVEWAFLAGNMLLMAGLCLQYAGLRIFKGKSPQWPAIATLITITFLESAWFSVLQPDVGLRAISNSVLFGLGCVACARTLLVPVERLLRLAHWFTGGMFALLAAMLFVRALLISVDAEGNYRFYASSPLNTGAFFMSTLVELCITVGLILMVHDRLLDDIRKLSSHDPLTGTFNRRRLEEEANRLLAHCVRTGNVLSIMLVDVDDLGQVNQRFSRTAGNAVLLALARVIRTSIRTDDYLARQEGNRFCLLMLSTTELEARSLGDRLRQAFAATTLEVAGSPLSSTVSVGVADTVHGGFQWEKLEGSAQQALHQAKQQGKNRTCTFTEVPGLPTSP